MAMQISRRLPALLLTVPIACFGALGASDAIAKKSPKHRTKHRAKRKRPGKRVPAGPSSARLQQLECAKFSCSPSHQILKLTILRRGTPHWGRVGDGFARNVAVYPMLLGYDEVLQSTHLVGGGYSPITSVTSTETTHWREKDNVLRNPDGSFSLRFVSSSATCEPDPAGCVPSVGGGA